MYNKVWYKIFLIILKYIPAIITIFYVLNTFLSFVGIDTFWMSYVSGISILTWIFLYVSSFVFNYCIYHRLFLYYIALNDIITIIDYHYKIPVTNETLFMLHSILLGIFVILIVIKYVTNHKKNTTKNSRQYRFR